MTPALQLPAGLGARQEALLSALADRRAARHGDGLLGLVLTGSAGRGTATERSDLDVFVVLDDGVHDGLEVVRSPALDEIPVRIGELESAPPFGTPGWWARWSFAWAPVLLDRTGGRLPAALRTQAMLAPGEVRSVLLEHNRLDGWINLAYRALKSDRNGRPLERRLDAAESVPWLLDTVFALAGRVRPYGSSLPWESRTHPLPGWPADGLLGVLEGLLDGDPAAIRTAFRRVEARCREHDDLAGTDELGAVVDGWGEDLALLRGTSG